MNWFGATSEQNERETPLMSMDSNATEPQPSMSEAVDEQVDAEAPAVQSVQSVQTAKTVVHLGASIPLNRANTGEFKMVVPPHLRTLIPVSAPEGDVEQFNNEEASRASGDRSMSTAVVSAISMSTAGGKEPEQPSADDNGILPGEIKTGKAPRVMEEEPSAMEKVQKVFGRFGKMVTRMRETGMSLEEVGNEFTLMQGDVMTGEMTAKPTEQETKIPRARRARNRDLLLPGNEPKHGFAQFLPPNWVWKLLGAGLVLFVFLSFLRSQRHSRNAGHLYDWSDKHSPFVDWSIEYSVAFVGNSYMYVNDIPRLVQAVGYPQINQDSCLATSASLSKLLAAGNGMYEYWQNNASILEDGYADAEWIEDDEYVHYDMGSCTVFQLLEGYDADLAYKNYNGAYLNTGYNPCFMDKYYLTIQQDMHYKSPAFWDYVVINDQTQRMADDEDREDSLAALKYAYAPMIKEAKAIPLIVDTHASPAYNRTLWSSIADFQAHINLGAEEYMMALKYNLPKSLAPKKVPIGLTYLAIHDDNSDMWNKLFLSDKKFPSAHGSYLFSIVLYTVMAGHLPKAPTSNAEIMAYFKESRTPVYPVYPTVAESDYLRMMAREVVLEGYIPDSFVQASKGLRAAQTYEDAQEEEAEEACEGEECEEDRQEEEEN